MERKFLCYLNYSENGSSLLQYKSINTRSTRVNTNQHESTRINTSPTRVNTRPTQVNMSPQRVNTNLKQI